MIAYTREHTSPGLENILTESNYWLASSLHLTSDTTTSPEDSGK